MFSKADTRLKELDEAHSEANRVKSENKIRESHQTLISYVKQMSFMIGQMNNLSGLRMHSMKMQMIQTSVVRVIDLYKIDKGLNSKDKESK